MHIRHKILPSAPRSRVFVAKGPACRSAIRYENPHSKIRKGQEALESRNAPAIITHNLPNTSSNFPRHSFQDLVVADHNPRATASYSVLRNSDLLSSVVLSS